MTAKDSWQRLSSESAPIAQPISSDSAAIPQRFPCDFLSQRFRRDCAAIRSNSGSNALPRNLQELRNHYAALRAISNIAQPISSDSEGSAGILPRFW
jgi:hypothetical protein